MAAPAFLHAADALRQHGGAEIADRDLGGSVSRRYALGDAKGDVARAARDVEQRLSGLRIEPIDEGILPQPVHAARHQIVHQVIALGYRRKDGVDQRRFFFRRHVAIPEGRGLFPSVHGLRIAFPVTIQLPLAMPELPEVETVRRGLAPALEGRTLASLVARRGDLRIAFPERFAERLQGRRMIALRRRAKYLLLDLEGGETLVMHLGHVRPLHHPRRHGVFKKARPLSQQDAGRRQRRRASTIMWCSKPTRARASFSPITGGLA